MSFPEFIEATYVPHDPANMGDPVPPNNWRGKFRMGWLIDDGPYKGQIAWLPLDHEYGCVPDHDLVDRRNLTLEEIEKAIETLSCQESEPQSDDKVSSV